MNEEEKNAIEYLKIRLYGNEGCKYIDVAQEDLRIFTNLIDKQQKENEELKKFITEGITVAPHSPYKNYRLDFLRENFVSKKKIKNKIEELEKDEYSKYYDMFLEERDLKYTIQILQELLKESEE